MSADLEKLAQFPVGANTLMVFGGIPPVQAAPVTYGFEVSATTGPLDGITSAGTFTFDDNLIPAGGGNVYLAGLLIDLNFTWNGIAYDETTANTGGLTFDASGELVQAFFGTACNDGGCGLSVGIEGWMAAPTGLFDYSVEGIPEFDFFRGTTRLTGRIEVPEPGTLAILAAVFLALGLVRPRNKTQRAMALGTAGSRERSH